MAACSPSTSPEPERSVVLSHERLSPEVDGTVILMPAGDKRAVCSARSVPPCDLGWLRVSPLQTRDAPSEPPLSAPVHMQVGLRHRARTFI